MGKDNVYREVLEVNGYRVVFKHWRHSHEAQIALDITLFYESLSGRPKIQPNGAYDEAENSFRKDLTRELDAQGKQKRTDLGYMFERIDGFEYQGLALAHYSPGKPEFVPGEYGGATTAAVYDGKNLVCTAMTYCSSKDRFDYGEGRKEALKEILMGMTCTA